MAIKIIKQGVKEFRITCPYCGCEDAKDFKFNLGNNRIVCAMYQSINGVTNKYGKDNEN